MLVLVLVLVLENQAISRGFAAGKVAYQVS